MSLLLSSRPDANSKYKKEEYFCTLLFGSIFKANYLRKNFALKDLGTFKDSVIPYFEEQFMKLRYFTKIKIKKEDSI